MLIFFPPLTHPFSVTTATEVEDLVGGKRDFLNVANPTFDKKEDEGGGEVFFSFNPLLFSSSVLVIFK